jgi:outer membrane lipoprotein SlyB
MYVTAQTILWFAGSLCLQVTGGFMKTRQIMIATCLTAAALMSACTNTGYQPVSSAPSNSGYSGTQYSGTQYGVVDAIEMVPGSKGGIAGSGIGAGTVIGGVVGGVLGHQVGGGSGKDIATAAGVVGGAVVGHEIEKRNQQQQNVYNVRVRLNNGGNQTITVPSVNELRVGDRVRIDNGNISRY